MLPAHRRLLGQLQYAPDVVVLGHARDALAGDAPLAGLLCGLLWARHERELEASIRRRAPDLCSEAMSDLQQRFVRWVYGQTPLTGDTLRGVARTMAMAAVKDAIRTARKHAGAPLEAHDVADPFDVLARLVHDKAVEELLAPLGARDRRIIEASLDDVPDDALAAELSLSPNALYVARHRALQRLRSHVEAAT